MSHEELTVALERLRSHLSAPDVDVDALRDEVRAADAALGAQMRDRRGGDTGRDVA